jgi:hypothetical protein
MEGFQSPSPRKIHRSGLKTVPRCEIEASEPSPFFLSVSGRKAGDFDRASEKPDGIDRILYTIS